MILVLVNFFEKYFLEKECESGYLINLNSCLYLFNGFIKNFFYSLCLFSWFNVRIIVKLVIM